MIRTVAAVLGSRAAAFELGILCQVFGLDRTDDGLPSYDFRVCAGTPGEVPTTSGFAVRAGEGLDWAAGADLVAVPAWPDLDAALDPAVADALRAAASAGAWVMSVCTGTFALAGAGLLDGRRATTHWQASDLFVRTFPRVRLDRDVLYVLDGRVLTSAGAAAGIDACLHLVRLEHGAAVANALARRLVVPPQREGGQAQYVETPVPGPRGSDGLSEVLDWAAGHLDADLDVAALSARAHLAPRTFARRFREVTGTTPHRWVLDQRLRLAEQLLETTDLSMDAVARRSGLGSADTLRHHFASRRGVSPGGYRRAFRLRPADLDRAGGHPARAGGRPA